MLYWFHTTVEVPPEHDPSVTVLLGSNDSDVACLERSDGLMITTTAELLVQARVEQAEEAGERSPVIERHSCAGGGHLVRHIVLADVAVAPPP